MNHGIIRLSRSVSTAACRRGNHFQPSFSVLQRWQSTAPAVTNSPAIPPRQWSTPLAKTIANAIEVTGPVSIAAYMRQCLTSPDGGYYTTTRPSKDQFGKKGDFITSPEISQIFGELVGVWFMTEWIAQGRPREGVQLMEVGPGRGTLIADVLRTISQFRSFSGAVEGVWLVEAGEGLRIQQKNILCGKETEMKEVKDDDGQMWWESKSKYGGIPVRWVEDIALLPKNDTTSSKMPFIIAHEFFDALPIYAFESVAPDPNASQTELLDNAGNPMIRQSSASKLPQWRELLVAPTKRKFNITTSAAEKPVSSSPKEPDPDFHLVVAKASNPSSLILPEHPRYRALKAQVGSRVEISPESGRYVRHFAKQVGHDPITSFRPSKALQSTSQTTSTSKKSATLSTTSSPGSTSTPRAPSAGAALIIDYGPLDTIPINSFRGIKSHKVISPFVHAGESDLSADVDFTALADTALEASENIEVHGPVEQGIWLTQLGIKERAERLLASLDKRKSDRSSDMTETQAVLEARKKAIDLGWKRLVEGGTTGMGKAYKVMAVIPENGGKRRPVGFGGDVPV